MTIRLTSVEAFEQVLEKLKQHSFYDEETNKWFFKYAVDDIKEGIVKGDDEWYLEVDFAPNHNYGISMAIRYHKRSNIMTDVEYLNDTDNDTDTKD